MKKGRESVSYATPDLWRVLFWGYAILVGLGVGLAIFAGDWWMALGSIASIFVLRIWLESVLVLFDIRGLLVDLRDVPRGVADAQKEAARKEEIQRRVARDVNLAPGEYRL